MTGQSKVAAAVTEVMTASAGILGVAVSDCETSLIIIIIITDV